MKRFSETSLTIGFYSLLTVLSTTGLGDKGRNHHTLPSSLILPEEGSRFNECRVIVETLDGKLTALDPAQNGAIQWSNSVSKEPLFSSSLSSVQMMKEFTGFRLIPSLDGGLYQFSWDNIEAIPLTADTLLSSSFKLNEGIGLVGGKHIQAMGVDPKTGKVVYSCSNGGCNKTGNSDFNSDILVIKRTQKTIRAVSERTGAERWNFSVGQHKINFLTGIASGSHDRIPADNPEEKKPIQISIPDGLIAGVKDKKKFKDSFPNNVVWQKRLNAPIAAVWWLENGLLEKLDLLKLIIPPKSLNGDNLPLMYYIGSHEDQLYVHPSDEMKSAVKVAIDNMLSTHPDEKQAITEQTRKRIIWKPYLATSASRTPTIVGKTELAVRRPLDYPFDNGHYFYGELSNFDEKGDCLVNSTNTDGKSIKKDILHKVKQYVSKWWRELIILVFTTAFFMRYFIKYWYKRILLGKTSTTTSVTVGDCSVSEDTSENNKQISQSSSTATILPPENFVSRYQCDFEHEVCLGKGAFGVVFQARNKLDDCQYAVKRIQLPNNQEARRKVMREVKVLATLDHPGIVRYYNSWCEEPPIEWLRDWDEKLKGDSRCPTLTSNASLTEESVDDRAMFEISASEEAQSSRSKSSRKRLDTLKSGSEENSLSQEETASDNEPSTSFNVEFAPHSFRDHLSNNNGKLNDDSSVVVFERSENTNTEDSFFNSSRSKSESKDSGCSSVKGDTPLHLLYIQMQLCHRDLKDWLNSNTDNRDYFVSFNIFKQLLDAVAYIHQKGHIHRDLKPSNILFARDGVVKVGDFGLVAACEPSVKEENDDDESNTSSNQNLTGQVGTHLYMSPEQVKNQQYCSKIDIYSLGIIFFELFHVFFTQMERFKVLTSVRQRKIPEKFHENMPLQSELVLWLLAENAKDRPSAQEILTCSLFKQILEELSSSKGTSSPTTL